MARWVLSPVIGDGSALGRGMTDATGPFRPAGVVAGRFLIVEGRDWCLVRTDDDPAALDADGRPAVIPEDRLDTVLTPARVLLWKAVLNRRGLDPGLVTLGMTVRDALLAIAGVLDGSWRPEWWPE